MIACPWPKVRLVEPTLGELRLWEDGYDVQKLDLGPTVSRVQSSDRTDADGAVDTTLYTGARSLSLNVLLLRSEAPAGTTLQQLGDDLAAYTDPSLVVELYYQARADEEERRCVVRGNAALPVMVAALRGYDLMQTSWRWPDGVQEGPEVVQRLPAGGTVVGGVSFPLSFPMSWPAAATTGVTTLTNRGKRKVLPLWRLYGPCTNPRIENRTTGKTFELTANTGIVLAAGEFVEVNMKERTVRLAADPAQSRFRQVDLTVSEWWPLVPGDNDVRYFPTAYDPGAAAEIHYRPAWS